MNPVAERIKAAIAKGLPGTEVQWEMASSDRMIRNFPRTRRDDSGIAAILFLLYPRNSIIHTCLIQRPEYIGVHGGQISFPGGKAEPSDHSVIDTALREAYEETGIRAGHHNVIGTLTPLFIPVSNTEVTPVVAWSDNIPSFRIDTSEVVTVIEANMETIANGSIVKEKPFEVRNELISVKYYDLGGNVVWGATAMIIHELITIFRREGLPFIL